MNIGPYSVEDYMHLVKSFHGNIAPGIIIGGFMVDLAVKSLPEGILFDAVCETSACLPDAVQLLTPCTIGNGCLKVVEFGRYALCLYDKYQGHGIRVLVDTEKLEQWPEIKTWFLKLKPIKEQDSKILRDGIINAGLDILSIQYVKVKNMLIGKTGNGAIALCPECNEAYPIKDGSVCLSCQGNNLYCRYSHAQNDMPSLNIFKIVKS
jgi:formylmethanofuran dehydrogenase subunit E